MESMHVCTLQYATCTCMHEDAVESVWGVASMRYDAYIMIGIYGSH